MPGRSVFWLCWPGLPCSGLFRLVLAALVLVGYFVLFCFGLALLARRLLLYLFSLRERPALHDHSFFGLSLLEVAMHRHNPRCLEGDSCIKKDSLMDCQGAPRRRARKTRTLKQQGGGPPSSFTYPWSSWPPSGLLALGPGGGVGGSQSTPLTL